MKWKKEELGVLLRGADSCYEKAAEWEEVEVVEMGS